MTSENKNIRFSQAKTSLKLIATVCAGLVLAACQTQPTKSTDQKVELVSTEKYIPVIQFDENGKRLPYEKQVNPYLEQKGRLSKGSVLLFIEAKNEAKKENFKSAKNKLKLITDRDKSLSGPWVLLAEIAIEENKPKVAEGHLNKAIKINPEHVGAYTLLGLSLRKQGKFNEAQVAIAKGLDQWKDFPEGHLNLAILYDIYLNQPEKAQRHMEAYQFLTNYSDGKVAGWLKEIQERTGLELNLSSQSEQVSSL